jgi:hypothetical protein
MEGLTKDALVVRGRPIDIEGCWPLVMEESKDQERKGEKKTSRKTQ